MEIIKVVIPKGEMPECCLACDRCSYNIIFDEMYSSQWFMCLITGTESTLHIANETRSGDCPLIESED